MNPSLASRLHARLPTPSPLRSRTSNLPLLRHVGSRKFTASAALQVARRPPNLNSGFSSSYDPALDTARGPMFTRPSFGVPQFYPRDLKARVDEYVVGQDRAKKTICSAIFNHYMALRRRENDQDLERMAQYVPRAPMHEDRVVLPYCLYFKGCSLWPGQG